MALLPALLLLWRRLQRYRSLSSLLLTLLLRRSRRLTLPLLLAVRVLRFRVNYFMLLSPSVTTVMLPTYIMCFWVGAGACKM